MNELIQQIAGGLGGLGGLGGGPQAPGMPGGIFEALRRRQDWLGRTHMPQPQVGLQSTISGGMQTHPALHRPAVASASLAQPQGWKGMVNRVMPHLQNPMVQQMLGFGQGAPQAAPPIQGGGIHMPQATGYPQFQMPQLTGAVRGLF